MRTRYVWLVCGAAILLVEALSAIALRGAWVSSEALHSLSYTLYLVAGVGAGRLEPSGRVRRAVWAGSLAGGFTGLVGGTVSQGMRWLLGITPDSARWSRCGFVTLAVIAVLTAAMLGLLGGIAGWGVRRAVAPAA